MKQSENQPSATDGDFDDDRETLVIDKKSSVGATPVPAGDPAARSPSGGPPSVPPTGDPAPLSATKTNQAPPPEQSPSLRDPSKSAFAGDVRRPLLGPSLWIFGALLWAYVVAGEFVVVADFPELIAILGVLLVYATSWFMAVQGKRSEELDGPWALAPGVLALALWGFTLVCVTAAFGSSSRSDIEAVTIGLWLLGAGVYFLGRRLTGPSKAPRSLSARVRTAGAWLVSGLATIAALVSAITRL